MTPETYLVVQALGLADILSLPPVQVGAHMDLHHVVRVHIPHPAQ